ncbi:AraC family transcriptional regulator ligand-binding domain-containing protein [Kluyvera cryocrescens]|uniref:AraC family transcriptional regulator ligand-binding domain-containing protein n=1 Tax=Kluyvera cryocrescens TaxID=580 RepID=UPI001E48B592|nr:AraC family transcriptional regulator ligand-binding domain-containing protein [Kluyvera cryocrescens]MEB7558277.1 AraC family transcriptional regulator [Kluyvera cryocrescens]
MPGDILHRAHLPDETYSRVERGLDTDEYIRLWHALEAGMNNPAFPLPLVEKVSADVLDPPLFAALCSTNMMQAVQRLARYKQLIAPMVLETAVNNSGILTISSRWLSATDIPVSLQVAELAFLLRLARLATHEPIRALNVLLPQLPTSAQAGYFTRFFRSCILHAEKPASAFYRLTERHGGLP